jgi:hypothetical protein
MSGGAGQLQRDMSFEPKEQNQAHPKYGTFSELFPTFCSSLEQSIQCRWNPKKCPGQLGPQVAATTRAANLLESSV